MRGRERERLRLEVPDADESLRRPDLGLASGGSSSDTPASSRRRESTSTNGSVSMENARESSSAFRSNILGRLSNPSATRWIVGVGDRENVGIERSYVAPPLGFGRC